MLPAHVLQHAARASPVRPLPTPLLPLTVPSPLFAWAHLLAVQSCMLAAHAPCCPQTGRPRILSSSRRTARAWHAFTCIVCARLTRHHTLCARLTRHHTLCARLTRHCIVCARLTRHHTLRQTHPAPHTLRQTHPAPHVCMLCVLHACIQVLYSKHILQGLSPLFTGQPAILSAFFPCAARLPAAPYTTVSECVRSAVRANGFRGPFQVSMRALCAGQGWCSACVDDGHFQAHARASSAGQGSSGIRWGGHPF